MLKILPLNKLLVLVPFVLGGLVIACTLWYAKEVEQRVILQSAKTLTNSLSIYRAFYSETILKRLEDNTTVKISHDFNNDSTSLPVPATMTQVLAKSMRSGSKYMDFSVISNYPFKHRKRLELSDLQKQALTFFEKNSDAEYFYRILNTDGDKRLHYIKPVHMQAGCVTCHNNHAQSPKRDWQVGDLRGVEEVVVVFPPFKWSEQKGLVSLVLLLIFGWGGACLLVLRMWQRNQRAFETVSASEQQLGVTNEALTVAKAKAEQSAESKSRFLAIMSHELRTPLNGIMGMTQLLSETSQSAEQRQYVETIELSSQGLLSMIEDILAMSRATSGTLLVAEKVIQTDVFFNQIIGLFECDCQQKGLSLNLNIDKSVPASLRSDDTKINQVVVNLLNNAVKFSDQGIIEVHVGMFEQAQQPVLEVSVTDKGIGIGAAQISRIFDNFVQLDETTAMHHDGVGLGLSICKSLVELMKGDITVESALGVGSTFSFRVPVQIGDGQCAPAVEKAIADQKVDETKKDRERKADVSEAVATDPLSILVAEDHPVNQQVITALLKKQGHTVTIAEDGEQAIQYLQSQTFDLVLMDLRMPNLDGLSATRKIR